MNITGIEIKVQKWSWELKLLLFTKLSKTVQDSDIISVITSLQVIIHKDLFKLKQKHELLKTVWLMTTAQTVAVSSCGRWSSSTGWASAAGAALAEGLSCALHHRLTTGAWIAPAVLPAWTFIVTHLFAWWCCAPASLITRTRRRATTCFVTTCSCWSLYICHFFSSNSLYLIVYGVPLLNHKLCLLFATSVLFNHRLQIHVA